MLNWKSFRWKSDAFQNLLKQQIKPFKISWLCCQSNVHHRHYNIIVTPKFPFLNIFDP